MRNIVYSVLTAILFFSFGTIVNGQILFYGGDLNTTNYHVATDIQKIAGNVDVETSPVGFSIESLQGGATVCIMQQDVLQKYSLDDLLKETSFTEYVRVLMPLGTQDMHLITNKNSKRKIDTFREIKEEDTKVAVVKEGPGSLITIEVLKQLTGGKWITVFSSSFNEAIKRLIKDEIHAIFYVGSAPISSFNILGKLPLNIQRNLLLVPIKDPGLVGAYEASIIPKKTYSWADYDVETYCVKSLLVTSIDGETDQHRDELETMLRAIKAKYKSLSASSGAQTQVWKKVSFDYSGITWEKHQLVKKIGTN